MTFATLIRRRAKSPNAIMAIRLFAGCYERFLFGFEFSPDQILSLDSSVSPPSTMERKYTFAAHKVSIDSAILCSCAWHGTVDGLACTSCLSG